MKKLLLTAQAVFVLGLTGGISPVSAQELSANDDLILKALPELADELENTEFTKSAGIKIKCYVDTPAYDLFSYNHCIALGFASTTTAVFNLENVPAGSTVIWSHSNCGANSSWCTFPISQYQSVNVSATILKPDSTYSIVNATAMYDGWR